MDHERDTIVPHGPNSAPTLDARPYREILQKPLSAPGGSVFPRSGSDDLRNAAPSERDIVDESNNAATARWKTCYDTAVTTGRLAAKIDLQHQTLYQNEIQQQQRQHAKEMIIMAKESFEDALQDHREKLIVYNDTRTDAVDSWERFVCDTAALNRVRICAAVTNALHQMYPLHGMMLE